MIIKFQEEDAWVIFGEIDHVKYWKIADGEPLAYPSDALHYRPANLPVIGNHVGMSFFTKNMNEATLITAYTPVYIMNDNGRTIETVN